jgi:hypothetical protein
MMIAVAFQVLQSRGYSLTCGNNSPRHFLTIHFQSGAEVRFHLFSDDVRGHDFLIRAEVGMVHLSRIARSLGDEIVIEEPYSKVQDGSQVAD